MKMRNVLFLSVLVFAFIVFLYAWSFALFGALSVWAMAGYSPFKGLLNNRATGLVALGFQTYSDQMGLRADTARAVGLCAVEHGSEAPHGEVHWQRQVRRYFRVSSNVLHASPYIFRDKSEV